MFIPDSFRSIQPQAITHEAVIESSEIIHQIWTCSKEQFTGQLVIKPQADPIRQGSLYWYLGRLVGGISPIHPIRRWCRQLFQYCPSLVLNASDRVVSHSRLQYLDYPSLIELMKRGKLLEPHMTAIVEGNLVEILFDLLQVGQQQAHEAGIQLTWRALPLESVDSAWISLRPDQVIQKAVQAWNEWCRAELWNYSPNLAPIIWDTEELQHRTSPVTYRHLTTLINGDRTLRDLAVKLKRPLLSLTQSLMPYVCEEVMGLVEAGDLTYESQPSNLTAATPFRQTSSSSPLVAYIEDSRIDSIAMSQILARAGCRFIPIRDPVQALPILLEQKPSLIFLDLLMPIANGYEVCAQIRRVSALQNTPVIIVTSNDGIVDRVRAKLAGSSDFIAKPITPDKILAVLSSYLPALQLGQNLSEQTRFTSGACTVDFAEPGSVPPRH